VPGHVVTFRSVAPAPWRRFLGTSIVLEGPTRRDGFRACRRIRVHSLVSKAGDAAQIAVVIYQITGYAKLLRAPGVPHRGLARNRCTAGREAALWWQESG
jgi:hypothetical protein